MISSPASSKPAVSRPGAPWLVVAVVTLGFYCVGASTAERFINYQVWPKIDPSCFRAYHHAQQPWILGFIVAPEGLLFALQVWLWRRRPPGIGDATVLLLLAASIVGALSTAFLQIPLHLRLDRLGYSDGDYRALMDSDWIRKACDLARSILLITVLRGSLQPAGKT